jgi:hypothetical protein
MPGGKAFGATSPAVGNRSRANLRDKRAGKLRSVAYVTVRQRLAADPLDQASLQALQIGIICLVSCQREMPAINN